MNVAYNMDCMEGMKQFPDKYFDLAVVDPPYGIGESGSKNNTRSKLKIIKHFQVMTKSRQIRPISMSCFG